LDDSKADRSAECLAVAMALSSAAPKVSVTVERLGVHWAASTAAMLDNQQVAPKATCLADYLAVW